MFSIPAAEDRASEALLQVEGLNVEFASSHGVVKAVRGVNLTVRPGQMVGIVGESGSGKSAMALTVLRLLPPHARTLAGRVLFDGIDLLAADERKMQAMRGTRLSLVPQDPLSALNPGLRIATQLGLVLRAHRRLRRAAKHAAAAELLAAVNLPDPEGALHRYPHELSGGQRQRVAIALALAGEPELVIADEATTALDATTQLQILDLFKERNRLNGLTMILIAHDLSVVASACDYVYVMQAGRFVEDGLVDQVLSNPQHSYTSDLISSLPDPERRGEPLGQNSSRPHEDPDPLAKSRPSHRSELGT